MYTERATYWGIVFFTCWLVLSFAVQWLRGRNRRRVVMNAVVGLGSWLAANAGLYLMLTGALSDVFGWALFVSGFVVLSGWLISPGGVHSVFTTPVGLLPIWREGREIAPSMDEHPPWGKESSKMAGFMLGLAGLMAVAVFIILRLATAR